MSETIEKKEVEIPLEKLPHLQITQKAIDTLKQLAELLNNRKKIAIELNSIEDELDKQGKSNGGLVGDYARNERNILLLKTDFELAKVHSNIVQKEMYFKDYMGNIKTILAEMELKWESLMEKAKTKKHNADLVRLLEEADMVKFEQNLEFKVNHYLQVKTRVYPDPKQNQNSSMRSVK